MLLVTGGIRDVAVTATTEVLEYGGSRQAWREVGLLPSPRDSLRAGVLGQLLHVTGGSWEDGVTGEVLLWDSISELWQGTEGALVEARALHAVAKVPWAVMEQFCM